MYRSILPYLSSFFLVLCLAAWLWNPQCVDLNSSLHLPPFQACQMILKQFAIAMDRKQTLLKLKVQNCPTKTAGDWWIFSNMLVFQMLLVPYVHL